MSALGVGVIGVGTVAQLHLDAYAGNPKVRVVALADRNHARVSEVAARRGIPTVVASYQELLSLPEVEAVSICTWNNTHAEIALAAIAAGKHVLIEKPLTITVDDALALQTAAASSDRVFEVGYVRRYSPNAVLLKRFIDSGRLGTVHAAEAHILRRAGNPGGWFANPDASGGGPLIDLGVHMIDLCWYLMGAPDPVTASGNVYSTIGNRANVTGLDRYRVSDDDPESNGVEDLVNGMLRFEGGASLLVTASYSLHAVEDSVRIVLYGDLGGAELEPALQLVFEENDTILNVTPQIDHPSFHLSKAFAGEIDHFVDACLGEAGPVAPLDHGVQMIRMLRALYESAERRSEVVLGTDTRRAS